MGHFETVEHLEGAGLAVVFGDHAGVAGAGQQLVLEGEISEQGLDQVLALLDGALDRGREPASAGSDDVRHPAEITDRRGEQLSALTALVGVGGELTLHRVGGSLGPPSLGDHRLGLGKSQQPIELRDKIVAC